MLQVARLAPKLLGDSSSCVVAFIQNSLTPEGGFQNRQGVSDLYYTVFGLHALLALNEEIPAKKIQDYLIQFKNGDSLDLVHLSSLARCWACISKQTNQTQLNTAQFKSRLEQFQAQDGSFNTVVSSSQGTLYGTFLAFGVYQDLGLQLPGIDSVHRWLKTLQCEDGGYSNHPQAKNGTTTSTAAAVMILHSMDIPVSKTVQEWLLQRYNPNGGGFFAAPGSPMPDLLSTATALHALERIHTPLEGIQETCLDFIDSLWTNQGGFYGHWADDMLDCEYTYYGLLSLGHLSF